MHTHPFGPGVEAIGLAGSSASRVDWARLATVADTIVVLMGRRRLPMIVGALLRHGRPPETPSAANRWGTTPRQRTDTATLRDLPDAVATAGLGSPIVVVVGGEVVRLGAILSWFDPGAAAPSRDGKVAPGREVGNPRTPEDRPDRLPLAHPPLHRP